jgi:hypothetical protein
MSTVIYRIETLGSPVDSEIHEATVAAFPRYRQIIAFQSPTEEKGSVPLLILEIVLTGGVTDRLLVHRLCERIKELVGDRAVHMMEIPVLRDRMF